MLISVQGCSLQGLTRYKPVFPAHRSPPVCVPAGESWTIITNPFLSDAYSPPLGLYWEPPCLVSKAVTPMVKAESELGP